MNRHYILKKADNSICVLCLGPAAKLEEELAKLTEDGSVSFTEVVQIDKTKIPKVAEYREAWEFNGSDVVYNLEKAKEVHRNKLRSARIEIFEKLDIEISKALAQGDQQKVSEIETKRQKLRDAPTSSRVASVDTLDKLKALTLDELTK
jgi:hypothetical protein